MKIKYAEFVISNQNYKNCPSYNFPEYAFIGRSNVGKSSLINALAKNKKLAKTSNKPGKTQLINHFLINHNWYLVDLPGYGYAKTSKKNRAIFQKMTSDYLKHRDNLICTFVLIDIRLKPQKIDQQFMQWLCQHNLPFVLIFTKADKLNKSNIEENINNYKLEMKNEWEELPKMFITSAEKKIGIYGVTEYIGSLNNLNQDS